VRHGGDRAPIAEERVPLRLGLALIALLLVVPGESRSVRLDANRARLLHRWAAEAADLPDLDSHARALRLIEQAIELDPDNASHWLLDGRVLEIQGFDHRAEAAYRRATALSPHDPEAWLGLSSVYKRQWLRDLDPHDLQRAIAALDTVTHLRPAGSVGWMRLTPLLYESGDLDGAAVAAVRALAGHPRYIEAALASAYTAYRTGDLARSDSLFKVAIPRLAHDLKSLFEDARVLGGLAQPDSELRAPDVARRLDAAVSALRRTDPDPTTPWNEAQLEWWSRVAHAYFLFDDPVSPGLDARAETYIRYGPPAGVVLNPAGVPLYFRPSNGLSDHRKSLAEYPLRAQVWAYPELGMRVLLHDRSLLGHWTQPVTLEPIPGTAPNPDSLARRGDLLSLGDGYAVLSTLPPRSQRLEARGTFTRFEGGSSPRLRMQLSVAATPADTLMADYAVMDSAGRRVASGSVSPGISVCDPAARRVGEFTADLPAGAYDVAFAVHDTHRRRAVVRRRVTLVPPSPGLALSDLVLCCGDASTAVVGSSVRIEADPDSRVARGASLAAYLEIYRLAPAADGLAHFQYDYAVHRLGEKKNEPAARLWASRQETYAGTVRRQFVLVRTADLPPGEYRVEIHVTDLVSGREAARSAEFVRE
jgi:cytochrome c-type biogenesis protein CcmH/NrfG